MPDQFSTLSTKQLHTLLRDADTLPLESLLNSGAVRIDTAARHIFRDSFWKGSFARDTALGFAEVLGVPAPGRSFAQGSFWKRFDRIEEGRCFGHVVNYEMHWLPGDPEVRAETYPDSKRAYFTQGAPFLLLNYRNEPYRIVYDAIKVIDRDRAIGVMHLGAFPNGLEFAAFVLERHNYPFLKMAAADYRLLATDPAVAPLAPDAAVGKWEGTLLTLADPNRVLLSQVNPHRLRVQITRVGGKLRLRYRIGVVKSIDLVKGTEELDLTGENEESAEEAAFAQTALDLGPGGESPAQTNNAIAGRWISNDTRLLKLPGMAQYAEPVDGGFAFHFYLEQR
ncbi:MAG: hypothetical protein R2762_24005 [Bryobacteraceae bacterium]